MVEKETRPLVVCDAAGSPVDVVLQNARGFKKTVESGTLWTLHPETARVLPYDESVAATIEDHGTWYRAVLAGTAARQHRGDASSVGDGAPSSDRATSGESSGAESSEIGTVLTKLAALIHERREEMPEGSYTTHLFEKGPDKIRKKTGEEAVELVLARDRAEMTSEAADLIYHLLVLLEVEDIPLDEVAAELRRR